MPPISSLPVVPGGAIQVDECRTEGWQEALLSWIWQADRGQDDRDDGRKAVSSGHGRLIHIHLTMHYEAIPF